MKMIRVLASAVAVLSLASSAAMAQGAPKVMKACAADMQKFCSGVADHHAARQCLRSHLADVSPECHSAMEAARAAARAARAARMAAGAPSTGAPPIAGPPAGAPH
jgi:hypothetical protein